MIRELRSQESRIRSSASYILGRMGSTVGLLLDALGDPDSWMRSKVIYALGELGDGRSLGPLSAALLDSDRRVRSTAADALEKSSGPGHYAFKETLREFPSLLRDWDESSGEAKRSHSVCGSIN